LTTVQRRVVIAAHDVWLRRGLRAGLETLGYVIWSEASDGLAALTQIRRARPHLVVVAPPLPSLDGSQVAETLIRGGLAPVVLVLREADLAAEAALPEASICARLLRPFSQRSLAEAVELARERFERLLAIRAELQHLRQERAGRMLLERAKSLLMRRLQIGEPEAFWRIQRYCLDSAAPARAAVEAMMEANRLVLQEERLDSEQRIRGPEISAP
jgi:two-component system, response regulator / RNA-binding antiterminator